MQAKGDRKNLWLGAVAVAFLVGLAIGWMYLGWIVAPVKWVDADPPDLRMQHKEAYVLMAADSYALTGDSEVAVRRLETFPRSELAVLIGRLVQAAPDTDTRERLNRLAEAVNVEPVFGEATPAPTAKAEQGGGGGQVGGRLLRILGALVVLVVIAGGGLMGYRYVQSRGLPTEFRVRRPSSGEAGSVAGGGPSGTTANLLRRRLSREDESAQADSLGQFVTTYKLGDDGYDTSFTIETPTGEFLGECGIGMSEILDEGPPQKVTAFEIWLFDKNDIRTVTKVLMSEYAYNDPTLTAKLKPKGELIIAQPNELLILETASLRVQVRTVEMSYGWEGSLPPRSYFENLVVEMTPTAKDAQEAPPAA
jgi:hypothetical protein